MQQLSIEQYYNLSERMPLLDVRSPGEFAKGHLPKANNLPLFSDEERAVVGTMYKQQGPEPAMLKGLDIAGRKMSSYISQAKKLVPGKKVAVHCWRGGKRSASIATLLGFVGYDVAVLTGGYKAYRNFVLEGFLAKKYSLFVLGGRTGSGKTAVLHQLREKGEQIIDLEGLAHHKGSAFGALGEAPQPTVEQFENDLFEVFHQLDPSRRVWVENESRAIGRVFVPQGLWDQICRATLVEIEVPTERRLSFLLENYGQYPPAQLLGALQKISTRMGGQNVKAAAEAFAAGDVPAATRLALDYYDRSYGHATDKKQFSEKHKLSFAGESMAEMADQLIRFAEEIEVPATL